MPREDLEADWLQDTLLDVAKRLCQSGVSREDLGKCASQLERIVSDLRSPTELEGRRTVEEIETAPTKRKRATWIRILGGAVIGVGALQLALRLVSDRNES